MRFFDQPGLYILPLLFGLLFFASSLTPTLIPRSWLVQGVLGGLVMGLGYMIGRFAISMWRLMEIPEFKGHTVLIVRLVIGLPVIIIMIFCLFQTRDWQNGIRSRMDMDLVESTHTMQMVLLALVVFIVLVLVGFALQWLFDCLRFWLYRSMPVRTANVAGFLLTVTIVVIVSRDGILDKVIANLEDTATVAQNLFGTAPPIPADVVTGGEGSFVEWASLGQPGRNYVISGPTAADITAFTDRDAMEPVRVYVGRAQADTAQERADVALAELQRQGGFDRDVLIVALPTGTGWLDPGAMDTVEYMHSGNIATVSVQYSYLHSAPSLIFETRSGLDQAEALISTVHNHWRDLPEDARPRLYIHGLSLGSWASMYGTDMLALLDDPIDGAFWAGPPFPSEMWKGIVASRKLDSPYVTPDVGDGQLVRFASHTKDAGGPTGWGDMRIAYLQYSSDPIVFYEPSSLFRAPAWMNEKPAADVSPDMRFIPIVTQFQLAVDIMLATSVPEGHGHAYYSADYIGPWVAVTAPTNWTDDDTDRLIAHCNGGFEIGCDH